MTREPLRNKVFVFTGEMSMEREEAKMQILKLGGRCTAVPSSKTTHLVAGGEPGPSKLQKAKELGIQILGEEEFLGMLKSCLEGFNDTVEVDRRADSRRSPRGETNYVWSEKYRPRSKDEVIGNAGLVKQLEDYLLGKTEEKAALLSGQPGIGKTTVAHLVCRSLGLNIVEFNASDVRSKSEICSKIKSLVSTQSISGGARLEKRVLIMDEIDGMTSDRGGIPELTGIIKSANMPIICICNDRSSPKIRSLANHCLDLRFRRPDARQIFPRIKHILQEEGKQMPDSLINELLLACGGDMRYILNTIQNLVLRKSLSSDVVKTFVRKNAMRGVFDVAAEVFQRKSIAEKIDLYFEDYSVIPLFVSENLLKLPFRNARDLHECCDSVSLGDVVEKMIRGSNQEWSLAPLHAFYSTVVPTHGKVLSKRIDFPSWLGQNSKQSRLAKILQTASTHSSDRIKMDSGELRKYGLELILRTYIQHLEAEDIDGAIGDIVDYNLLKEDMVEMCEVLPGGVEWLKRPGRRAKMALDREYKKLSRRLSYVLPEDCSKNENASEEEC